MESSLKNVLVVSFGFLLLFTAFGGLQNLQSSLYREEGLGVAALSTIYGAVLVSSMFLPSVLIKKLGCKWSIVISMCCYVAFSLGNFYASWYTLIPTSIMLGLGAAPLWSAHCTYLTIVGNTRAEEAGKIGKNVVNQYFGIFFLVFQSSGVWGNLISSLVFGQKPTQGAIPEENLLSCGASDCLMATASTNSTQSPSQELIYTLLGIYTGSGVLAVLLVATFLQPIKDVQEKSKGEEKSSSFWSTLLSTFKLLRDKRLCLLVLLPVYSGFQQAFLSVVRHLRPGDPVCWLRDDLLLGHQRAVLRALREDLPVHGQNRSLHAGHGHPRLLCHRPLAVETTPSPAGRVLRVFWPLGHGRRRLADTKQCLDIVILDQG
nr:protein unc-93 homolog A isoform X5 [Equus asinus]